MDTEHTKKAALHRAIKTVGSMRELADAIGVKPARVNTWRYRNLVPAEFILPIEKASGVARHKLRPDIYPPEEYDGLC